MSWIWKCYGSMKLSKPVRIGSVRRTSKENRIGGTKEQKGVGLGVFHLCHRVRTTQVPPTRVTRDMCRMIHVIESCLFIVSFLSCLYFCFLVIVSSVIVVVVVSSNINGMVNILALTTISHYIKKELVELKKVLLQSRSKK